MRLRLRFDRPSRRDLVVFGGYCAAALLYIAIGVWYTDFLYSFWAGLGYLAACGLYVVIGVLVTDFLLSVFVGIAYLLVVAWLVPAAVRRIR